MIQKIVELFVERVKLNFNMKITANTLLSVLHARNTQPVFPINTIFSKTIKKNILRSMQEAIILPSRRYASYLHYSSCCQMHLWSYQYNLVILFEDWYYPS